MSQTVSLPPGAGPRQKRALATRAALLDAVERIVEADGPDAVTTTRVAGDVGVAVGTIYRYFADREALLLAAYDATVARIVASCRAVMDEIQPGLAAAEAANVLLRRYLDAADAIPAHRGLLRAMRAIRPIERDQTGSAEADVVGELIAPALARFLPRTGTVEPGRLRFMSVSIGTMVDFYLVTLDAVERERIAGDIEAHLGLMIERLSR